MDFLERRMGSIVELLEVIHQLFSFVFPGEPTPPLAVMAEYSHPPLQVWWQGDRVLEDDAQGLVRSCPRSSRSHIARGSG